MSSASNILVERDVHFFFLLEVLCSFDLMSVNACVISFGRARSKNVDSVILGFLLLLSVLNDI